MVGENNDIKEYNVRFFTIEKYENFPVSKIKFTSSVEARNINEAIVKTKKGVKDSTVIIGPNMNARIIGPGGIYRDILTNGKWLDDSEIGELTLEDKLN